MAQNKNNDSVLELIQSSGNNFHYKVIHYLRSKGWTVMISPYYRDHTTDKPREIDIIAEKLYPSEDFFTRKTSNINCRLFIECKYIAAETVFWFDKKDNERAIERTMRDTGMSHPDQNGNIKGHRYLTLEKTAKLFASSRDKILENEVMYKALNQALNGMIYNRNRASLIPNVYTPTVATLNYPLIVCNSFNNFYGVDVNKLDEYASINDNFLLEVNYAYSDGKGNDRDEYFLIDVINFDLFDKFISEVEEKDISIVRQHHYYAAMSRGNRNHNEETDY